MLIDYYNKPKKDFNTAFQEERERIKKFNQQRLNQKQKEKEIAEIIENQLQPLIEKSLDDIFKDFSKYI